MHAREWNGKVNERGWKIPSVRKSLFQIGKDLRPAIDKVILRHSLVPDQAVMDKSFFHWIARLEQRWQDIRDETINIRREDIPVPIRRVPPCW
jgi:aspartyl/asparaginyl beta-hydroxylase (cupin superfamily)